MMTKYPYFPGCSLKAHAKHFETSAIASLEALNVELVELPRWNCCGVVASLATDDLMRQLAPVRVLVRAQSLGRELGENGLIVPCAMCYATLKLANEFVKDKEKLETINLFMDQEEDYTGGVEVIHILQLLKDIGYGEVKKRVKKPLSGLSVAPYYGCYLLRPEEVAIDNREDPKIMEELLLSLGADAVSDPYRIECCGSYHTAGKKDVVVDLCHTIIESARRRGAEALALACPLCQFNLDSRQKEVGEKYYDFRPMPIFYITQLLAMAFGLPRECWGLDGHYVDPISLLKRKGVI